jgi:DNA-nicking Smr family endonuclease
MKPLSSEADARLWTIITATVRPLRGRATASPAAEADAPAPPNPAAPQAIARVSAPRGKVGQQTIRLLAPAPPQTIEPGRRRRLERGRDQPAATLDLHGLSQDAARAVLTSFLLHSWTEHRRNLLVITGKGALGDGVLRRRVPEWLAEPPLRNIVAGISEAHRRHGGGGALYVALKRADIR